MEGISGFDEFRRFLSGLKPVPAREWAACEPWLVAEHFEKLDIIQHPGGVCERVVFLVAGLARTSVNDAEGRDFVWELHFGGTRATLKNRFLVDYASLIKGDVSPFLIEAMSRVEAVSLSREAVERLYASSAIWSDMGRRIAEAAYYHTQRRTLDLLCLSARERYRRLLVESPGLVTAAPQHMIAAYLGITPQSLSRIRRELASEGVTKCE